MAELDVLVQPEEYRKDSAPAWAFFHNLRLLLGWGEGLWETLGDDMSRVRTVFVILTAYDETKHDQLKRHFEWIGRYDEWRPAMPYYARALYDYGASCARLHANAACETFAGPSQHPLDYRGSSHPIEADENYQVTHDVPEDRILRLTLERRSSKTLKPEFQAKMAEFGLAHERGVGRREENKAPGEKRVRRQRDPKEQAFTEHLEALKRTYHEKRNLQLIGDPDSRPPCFLVVMARQERLRLEDVARGKNGQDGLPYAPYTNEQLLARTAHSIASAEATDLAFDYVWTPVLRFDRYGLTKL